MKHYLAAITQWTVILFLRFIMMVLGVFVVPFAMPNVHPFDGTKWRLQRLKAKKIFDPFDNPRDGIYGDSRLDFWNTGDQFPKWMADHTWLKCYWWMAWRNPCNNFSRYYKHIGCDVSKCVVKRISGNLYAAIDKRTGKKYYNYISKNVWIGYKVEMKHNTTSWISDPMKAYKDCTFRIRFKGEI